MARKEVVIPIAVVLFVLSGLGGTFVLFYHTGGKVVAVEKDIEAVGKDVITVSSAITENKDGIEALGKEVSSNYKELKEEANEAKLRDARIAKDYASISSHMIQQTEINRGILGRLDEQTKANQAAQISMTKIDGRLDSMEIKVDNLQKAD